MSEQGSATRSGTPRTRRARAASDAAAPKTPTTPRTPGTRRTPGTPPGGQPWTAGELAAVRGELEEQAQELRGEIDSAEASWTALQRDAGEGAGDDQADAGSKTFEREHELSLANNSRDLLAQVERALGRLADGTYGVCESCSRPIAKARLQAFPRATLCVACKQREERR